MSIVQLNIPDYPDTIFTTILDNVSYDLTLQWNDRDEAWYLSLSKQNRDPLFKVKITTVSDLFKPHRALNDCPKGMLVAIDTMKKYGRITRNGWSSGRWKLYYLSESTYQELLDQRNSISELNITVDVENDPRFTPSETRL